MTDKTLEAETPPADEEFVKADPTKNPRNQSLAEIAKTVAEQHKSEAAETAPTVDDEGNITQPAAARRPATSESTPPEPSEEPPVEGETPLEEPPADQPPPAEGSPPLTPVVERPVGSIDPSAEYEVEIDGQKVKVPGAKIIEAGYRTFQKETAADFRLNMASQLLREAERRAAEAPAPPSATAVPSAAAKTDAELAHAIQFGAPEQAAEAIAALKSRGTEISPQQIQQFVVQQTRAAAADEIAFQEALTFVKSEYKDILSNDYLKRLFFVEENRRRAPRDRGGEGDARPYKELYQSIGEDLRKNFNLQKSAPTPPAQPTSTAAERRVVKAATPPIPRTAASRLEQAERTAKAKTPSEIIAQMAESRGKTTLVPRLARKE